MHLYFCVLVVLTICCLGKSESQQTDKNNKNLLSQELRSTCSSSKMVVTGIDIKISDALDIACAANAKFIEIFAFNKVIIDVDIDKTGLKVQLSIIAPTWEIIGRRKIILNGRPAELHSHPFARDSLGDGKDGKPGKPGGAAGCFLGIGNDFINDNSLEVYVRGGLGGTGQHGGNGTDGMKGVDPPLTSKSTETLRLWEEQKFNYFVLNVENTTTESEARNFTKLHQTYMVLGKGSLLPGSGGNGGVGGIGGNFGEILVLGLNETPKFSLFIEKGENGTIGVGGAGGNKTTEVELVVEYKDKIGIDNTIEYGAVDILSQKITNTTSGKYGIDGYNFDGIEYPDQERLLNPSHIINSYKFHAREYLAKNTSESVSDLQQFLKDLDENQRIRSDYDTLGFVDELEGLEKQYLELQNSLDFGPFVVSLLNRTSEYANNMSEPIESKKILKFVYTATATLSKLVGNRTHKNAVFNLIEYIDIVQEQVRKLREANRNVIITANQEEYKNSLIKKVNLSTNFIGNQVVPEIENIFNDTDAKIFMSLKAVHGLLAINRTYPLPPNATLDGDIESLYKEDLVKSMLKNKIIDVERIAPFLLKSLVSVGSTVAGVAMNDERLGNEKIQSKKNKQYLSLAATLNASVHHVGKQLKNNHELFLEHLNDIANELQEYLKETDSNSDNEMLQKVNEIKDAVIDQMENSVIIDPTEIDGMRIELKQLFDDSNLELPPQKSMYLTNKLGDLSNTATDIFKEVRNDQIKLKKISNKNSHFEDILGNRNITEKYFYSSIVSLLHKFENFVNDVQLADKSHIELDITEWRIQSALRDLKVYFRQASKDIPERDDVERSFEKLDEAINILISLYDRIDSFSDQMKWATYVANIVSGQPQDTIQSNGIIQRLQQIIQINLVLEKYQILMHAFKQHRFPLAHIDMSTFELPKDLQLNDTENIMQNVMDQIDYLKEKIKLLDISKYDRETYSDVDFFSNASIAGPFYTWKYVGIKNEVNKLLEGEEITINADIVGGVNLNAVKFNKIGIKLKIMDENKQKELDVVLEDFGVTMTMVGNNYYRCGSKFYCISAGDNIVIDYSFKTRPNGEPTVSNEVFKKLNENGYFLSPYGMWIIKLKKFGNTNGFDKLNEFINQEIDLELTGRGQYFDNGPFIAEICNDDLGNFYNSCPVGTF